MDYYKNLDLNDIVYFCEFDKIEKTEQWKNVPDYEGIYQVSDLGRVKSLSRIIKYNKRVKIINQRILKLKNSQNKYINCGITKNGIKYNVPLHYVVANVFLNHVSKSNKLVINHINLNKHDNRLSNLEIIPFRKNTWYKNIKTTSKYPGVCWNRFVNKWQSQIKIKGKSIYLGRYDNEIDAHNAYQNAYLKIEKPQL